MATYKVKPESLSIAQPATAKDKEYYPTVCFPVSKDMISSFSPGDEIEVTLKGKITSLESRSSEDSGDSYNNKSEVRMELYEVNADAGNVYEKMASDDESAE